MLSPENQEELKVNSKGKFDWHALIFGQDMSRRMFGLDLMRAIAILQVMMLHGSYIIAPESLWWYSIPAISVEGVSLFFVLSGFLIGGILLRILEKTTFGWRAMLNFLIRRWFRTIPNYWLALILILGLGAITGTMQRGFSIDYVFFFQNFFWMRPPFYPESWSLTIEEWFYLLVPLSIFLLALIKRTPNQSIFIVSLIFIVLPNILRIWHYSPEATFPEWPFYTRIIVVYRLDSVMMGIVLAWLYRYRKEQLLKYKNIGMVLALVLIAVMTFVVKTGANAHWYESTLILNLEPLIAFLAIPYLAEWKTTRYKTFGNIMQFLSVASYAMYILNLTIVQTIVLPILTGPMDHHHPTSPAMGMLRLGLFWLITVPCAWVLYRFYETPMRNLRDKVHIREDAPKKN